MNIEDLKDVARQNLRNCVAVNSDFASMAFFMDGDQPIVAAISLNSDKYEMYRKLGAMLGLKNITDVILLNDCAFRTVNVKDFQFVKENYNTESPLSYPESMRTEALVFAHINFKEKDKICMMAYKKYGKEVEFLSEEFSEGGFDGAIRSSVVCGFVSSNKIQYPNLNGEMNK